MSAATEKETTISAPPFRSIAGFFLKLGTIAFGSPAVHLAMREDDLVCRRRWVSPEDFLDLLAVSTLLPGLISTELAIFLGFRLGGIPGILVAGTCFILPVFLIVAALAWAQYYETTAPSLCYNN